MALAVRELAPQTTEAEAPPKLHTEEEYLAREEAAEERSEYVYGEIQPMSGGTDYHGALAMYLGYALIAALRGRGFLVMSSGVKVYADGALRYPDLSVVQGPRIYHGANRTIITNPALIAEVLSPSTERKDRGEKLHDYLAVPSLQVYLLVSQDEPRVEMYSRGEKGHWDYLDVIGADAVLDIPALSVSLSLADIYEQIEFNSGADEAEL